MSSDIIGTDTAPFGTKAHMTSTGCAGGEHTPSIREAYCLSEEAVTGGRDDSNSCVHETLSC